jgi:hypothetical protein
VIRIENQIFRIELVLKSPNDLGVALNFTEKKHDIYEAIHVFNDYYKKQNLKSTNTRSLQLEEIYVKSIVLLLSISSDEVDEVNGRTIQYFSRYLYHQRNWGVYTRFENKLFRTKNEIQPIKMSPEEFQKKEHELLNLDDIMTDEEMVDALRGLLLSKKFGDETGITKKRKIIYEIKRLLNEAFSVR